MAVSLDIEDILSQGKHFIPDLSISHSDLVKPSMAILTKIFVHYLRCFGFRVEPPFKLGNETIDQSRETRVFLIRLCRQIESIVKISYPNKTYLYMDLMKPANKKTLSTLGSLFNYLAYYKMFKKNVLGPVEQGIKVRDALLAEFKVKQNEFDQNKEAVATIAEDMEACKLEISQLKATLQETKTKLVQLKKSASEQEHALESHEHEENEQSKRIKHWEQLVVEEHQVMKLKKQIQSTSSHVESCKKELASKEQLINNLRSTIEASQQIVLALEKATPLLPLSQLDEYKENAKELDSMREQLPALEARNQKILQEAEARKKLLREEQQKIQHLREKYEADSKLAQEQIEKRETEIEDRDKSVKELQTENEALAEQIEKQEYLRGILCENIENILGENSKWH
ncbi:hypothetical protein KR054_004181 [Drosophila jambulina]|nr:hypothetical protein KR054_004181 [Drosophila jambulina]